jgi:hypothetical protein
MQLASVTALLPISKSHLPFKRRSNMHCVFILSPARTSGKRAAIMLNPAAKLDLAERVREDPGARIGEVFSFLGGLYFRGKLTYARHFGRASQPFECCYVITSCSGLVSATLPVTAVTLPNYAEVPIALADERYAMPLRESAHCDMANSSVQSLNRQRIQYLAWNGERRRNVSYCVVDLARNRSP